MQWAPALGDIEVKLKLPNMIKVTFSASYLILTYFGVYLHGYSLHAMGLGVVVCHVVHHLLILVLGSSPVVIESIHKSKQIYII